MKMYITPTIKPLLLLLLLLALVRSSFGTDITLSSVDDFTVFVNNVNSGNKYSGTTVYLGSDIALSGSIDPIGDGTSNYFRGAFDGKGYIINNLTINFSSQYTGLFGYSTGLTIRNVVLDDSCSITSSFKNSNSGQGYVGGIVGRCYANSGECNIENSVNMAGVTFSGNISSYLYIGGVIGSLSSFSSSSFSSYNAHMKNCVNYGSVTHSGTVGSYAELGGIVGISSGSSPTYSYIQNCLNYGTITHNGTSANLMIGGIVGNGAYYTYIENCLSAGKISTNQESNYIGGIVGKVGSDTHINYCYYTSDVNVNSIFGTGTPETTIGSPDSPTGVDPELVSKLNSNATSCNWDNWFMLHLNGGSINNLMQELLIEIQGHIPNPVKEGNSFLFWCNDTECNEKFDPETVSGITALYAGWTPNNYTVTFDANGGNISETSKIVTFNEKYGELPKPNRAEYVFFGWLFTNETNGTEVTNETIVITAYNHTLYAHWEEVTAYVEIVFNTKDLTKEDVEKLIEKYAEAKFTIVKYENGSDGLRVIVGFVDKKEAEIFFSNIKESNKTTNMIKRIDFVTDDAGSFSTTIYPLPLFSTLFL